MLLAVIQYVFSGCWWSPFLQSAHSHKTDTHLRGLSTEHMLVCSLVPHISTCHLWNSTVKPLTLPTGNNSNAGFSTPLCSSLHHLLSSLKERGISLLISAWLSCRRSSYYRPLLAWVFQEPMEHPANHPFTVMPIHILSSQHNNGKNTEQSDKLHHKWNI